MPQLALVIRATFLHLEETGAPEGEPEASPACSGRPRRSASVPAAGASAACWAQGSPQAATPLYIEDGTPLGWRKVASAPEIERRRPSCRRRCWTLGEAAMGSGGSAGEVSPASSGDFGRPRPPASSGASTATPSPQHAAAVAKCEAEAEAGRRPLTTVMMRNLPNAFTRDQLLELLVAEGFGGRVDFLYLPTDFKTYAGLGFAFINLVSPADAQRLRDHFTGFQRWGVPTRKVCSVSWATPDQQGLKANVERYRNSSVMHKSVADRYKPMLLVDGVPVKFPRNTKRLWPPHSDFGVRAHK